MPSPISLVLFDMDDVLCDYSRAARCAHLGRLAGRAPEAIHAALWASGFEAASDGGSLETDAYLAEYGRRIGYALTRQEWLDARRAATRARPTVLRMAAEVSARARVAVLTNNPALLAEDIDLLVPELRPVFGAHIYASGGFKLAKPDPRCFRHCLSLLGAHPEETLLIDDLAENVAGAEAAGLKAHLYTTEENLAVALREHGVLA